MAELVFDHRISYPDNHGITLSDIANTLKAQEKLLPIAIQSLENVFPGLVIQGIKIELRYARIGSLDESFFIAVLTAYQKDFDRAVPDFVEHMTGMHVPDEVKPILSVLFVLIVFYGLKAAAKRLIHRKEVAPELAATISGDYNTYINLASATLNVSPGQVENAISAAVTDKKKEAVEKAAIDFVRPAKRGEIGKILVEGAPDISPATVAASPDAASGEEDDPVDRVEFKNSVLEIRATDLDKINKGWAGRIYSGFTHTKRLKLSLYPGVDKDLLASKPQSRVDAILEVKTLPDGTQKPVMIHVVRIIS